MTEHQDSLSQNLNKNRIFKWRRQSIELSAELPGALLYQPQPRTQPYWSLYKKVTLNATLGKPVSWVRTHTRWALIRKGISCTNTTDERLTFQRVCSSVSGKQCANERSLVTWAVTWESEMSLTKEKDPESPCNKRSPSTSWTSGSRLGAPQRWLCVTLGCLSVFGTFVLWVVIWEQEYWWLENLQEEGSRWWTISYGADNLSKMFLKTSQSNIVDSIELWIFFSVLFFFSFQQLSDSVHTQKS